MPNNDNCLLDDLEIFMIKCKASLLLLFQYLMFTIWSDIQNYVVVPNNVRLLPIYDIKDLFLIFSGFQYKYLCPEKLFWASHFGYFRLFLVTEVKFR